MRQVLQSLRDGVTRIADVPCPKVRAGHLLIQTHKTLISAGTERMVTDFGKAGWLGKARQQPDKVRQVIEKVRTDGLAATIDSVLDKLDAPVELGYCNVGTVIDVGPDVVGFEIGDRVLSNGHHAEVVCVPKNLCAKIPDEVSDQAAVFGVLGAIALQGIRLAQPTLGEGFLVSGLGLIGLLAVQLLRANGIRVLGADFNPQRLELAKQFGAETVDLRHEDLISKAATFSRGQGIDGVLLTVATSSHEPMHQAAEVSRKRGRIVLVGVTGLQLSREDFYKKELSFQVSCSYGPGRYDAAYEDQGRDYPLPFVRWTEQRNFTAMLDLLAAGALDVEPLISHRFSLTDAAAAYEVVSGKEPSLGILLEAATADSKELRRDTIPMQSLLPRGGEGARRADEGVARGRGNDGDSIAVKRSPPHPNPLPHGGEGTRVVTLGVIGAGGFATKVLLPAFRDAGATCHTVASRGGVSAVHAAKKFGFARATTDIAKVIDNNDINTVVIATRHDSHADLVCRALAAGKHVFVEKPLASKTDELQTVIDAYQRSQRSENSPLLMVGFNRRFAPHVVKMKSLLAGVSEPKSFVLTVNAGAIPADHWLQDRDLGGGRIIGEGCHFVDLLRFLCGQPIANVQAAMLGRHAGIVIRDDKLTCTLTFADGSVGTIHYLANGHRSFPKERLEVFCAGRILQLDNFRTLRGYGWPGFRRMSSWRQDKGHRAEVAAFCRALTQGGESPIPFAELAEVTQACFDILAAVDDRTSMTRRQAA